MADDFRIGKLFHLTPLVDDLADAEFFFDSVFSPLCIMRNYSPHWHRDAAIYVIAETSIEPMQRYRPRDGEAGTSWFRYLDRFGPHVHNIAFYVDDAPALDRRLTGGRCAHHRWRHRRQRHGVRASQGHSGDARVPRADPLGWPRSPVQSALATRSPPTSGASATRSASSACRTSPWSRDVDAATRVLRRRARRACRSTSRRRRSPTPTRPSCWSGEDTVLELAQPTAPIVADRVGPRRSRPVRGRHDVHRPRPRAGAEHLALFEAPVRRDHRPRHPPRPVEDVEHRVPLHHRRARGRSPRRLSPSGPTPRRTPAASAGGREVVVHRAHRARSLADRRRHALHRTVAHVADREHAGHRRLERAAARGEKTAVVRARRGEDRSVSTKPRSSSATAPRSQSVAGIGADEAEQPAARHVAVLAGRRVLAASPSRGSGRRPARAPRCAVSSVMRGSASMRSMR